MAERVQFHHELMGSKEMRRANENANFFISSTVYCRAIVLRLNFLLGLTLD